MLKQIEEVREIRVKRNRKNRSVNFCSSSDINAGILLNRVTIKFFNDFHLLAYRYFGYWLTASDFTDVLNLHSILKVKFS